MRLSPRFTTISLIFLLILLISISLLNQPQKSTPMSSNSNQIDPFHFLHIIQNPNGTITRIPSFFPTVPPSIITNTSSLSLSKDVIINKDKHTWVRIFLPTKVSHNNNNNSNEKVVVPILVFVHGGGFVLCSAGSPVFHEFCDNAASQLGVLVVSVEYRLAPESRLPAAYDDVLEVLKWVRDGQDLWVKNHGDLSRCVLMGESAGGNIVYHVGLEAAIKSDDLKPLNISGLILVQPYFGGIERTNSEIRLVNDLALPLVANDLMWNLSLPLEANRSHEFCDPFTNGGSKKALDRVRDLGWSVGMVVCDGDPLYDREEMVVKLLEQRGVRVKSLVEKGGDHGIFVSDITMMKALFEFVKGFF